MKPVKMLAICAVTALTLSAATLVTGSAASTQQHLPATGNGFAVLELFTSEGCSSCPPADAVIARIQQEAANKPVYVLAYHVDYWDRLGWKDKFSDARYSARQRRYSELLGSQVYTPQLVINGRSEYIGSNETAVNNAVKNALDQAPAAALNIQGQVQAGRLLLSYQVTGHTSNSRLLVAVVQKHAVSKVQKGENGGRTLSHVQIVRNLHAFDLAHGKAGTQQINLPNGFNTQDWEIIGLVQNRESGVIDAAARLWFP
jgi:hypothetical protein